MARDGVFCFSFDTNPNKHFGCSRITFMAKVGVYHVDLYTMGEVDAVGILILILLPSYSNSDKVSRLTKWVFRCSDALP